VAEGISVFVASGDTGPESCVENLNFPYNASEATGLGVDGWVSTPYDVAVGGTDFGDTYANSLSTYWASSSVAPWGSAKSYIPEIPWNDTCASTLTAVYYGFAQTYGLTGFCNSQKAQKLTKQQILQPIIGTNGGPSSCAIPDPSTGKCQGYPKPAWQQGFVGNPDDYVRDVPDVSIFASDGNVWHQSYALCYSDPRTYGTACKGNPGKWAGPGNGGTSFAAPIVAGIQALINQKIGMPQGNPNWVYYRLAANEYGTSGFAACNSSNGNMILPSTCIFYDITLGGNDMDCANATNCYRPSGAIGVESKYNNNYQPTFPANIGYDFATGIGSINAANLVNNWPN
jgi:subtilase family serine protease